MAFKEQNAPVLNEVIKRVNKNTHRVRALEEFNRILENKMNFLEERGLKTQEELKQKFEEIEKTLKDLNIRLMKIENENQKIRKSLEKVVTKPELEEIENFVKLFNPIKMGFVTRSEVEKMIRESK